MKKVFPSLLCIVMTLTLGMPQKTLAQEQEDHHISTSELENIPTEIKSTDTLSSGTEVQATISSESLESTDDPQREQALESAIEIIDQGTTEREATELNASSTEEAIVIEVEPEGIGEAIVVEAETETVTKLDEEVLVPTKEYMFEISGETIATKQDTEWSTQAYEGKVDGAGSALVTEAPELALSPDGLTVSGVCDDLYYVILIYRNAEDYDKNPSSYIYNKAFPCGGGRYQHDLRELPFNLESGTFYLLVGSQGARGGWNPLSALTPVGITVKEVMVPEENDEPNE